MNTMNTTNMTNTHCVSILTTNPAADPFDSSIDVLLSTSNEEEALRSRVVVLTAQTIRAQTAQVRE